MYIERFIKKRVIFKSLKNAPLGKTGKKFITRKQNAPSCKEFFEIKDEIILYEKVKKVEKKVKNFIKKNDFKAALISLSTFDCEIENFFEKVVINVENQHIKTNRLNLCNKVRKVMHSIAYFGHLNV